MRYENKTKYDPGRFRYPVIFLQETATISEDGSQTVGYTQVLSTRAIREAVTRRFNIFGDISIVDGATLMNNYWYFTIRFLRSGFTPLKNMLLSTPDGLYTINATPELDEPPNYWKMLCVKTDTQVTIYPGPPVVPIEPTIITAHVTPSPITVNYSPLVNPRYELKNTATDLIDTNTNIIDTGTSFIINGDADENGLFAESFEFTIST